MDSLKSMLVAVSALRTQAEYMRDVADDLAYCLAGLQGSGPVYDAPIALFDDELGYDFREVYMPGHPAADERGYVRAEDFAIYPAEPTEAQIAYEAQLEAMKEALEADVSLGGDETPDADDDDMIATYG